MNFDAVKDRFRPLSDDEFSSLVRKHCPQPAIVATAGCGQVMPVWRIESIEERPEIVMLDWRVYEVRQADRTERTRHIVGSAGRDDDGQSSSAIVQFDPETRCGLSERGRIYKLAGRGSGLGVSADYVWSTWKRKTGAQDVVDVTSEIETLLSKREIK